MKRIITLTAISFCSIAAVGCNRSAPDVDSMLFSERAQMLASYRASNELCQSDSGNCMAWTGLALKCEMNMVEIDKGNYASQPYRGACTAAESFRERITGIELSSAPKAFAF